MPKPVTPLSGCDVFVLDAESRVLLIRRSDTGLWGLPGGCQELSETAAETAARECFEETGYSVRITHLMGVWSSTRYEYINYPWKNDVFNHILFGAEVTGGELRCSEESPEVAWFAESTLPSFSDGHECRVRFAFDWLRSGQQGAYFE